MWCKSAHNNVKTNTTKLKMFNNPKSNDTHLTFALHYWIYIYTYVSLHWSNYYSHWRLNFTLEIRLTWTPHCAPSLLVPWPPPAPATRTGTDTPGLTLVSRIRIRVVNLDKAGPAPMIKTQLIVNLIVFKQSFTNKCGRIFPWSVLKNNISVEDPEWYNPDPA